MSTWAFGWQYSADHVAFITQAVAPDPDPDPGFGQMSTVYDYVSGSQFLFYMPNYLQFDPHIRDLMDAMGEEVSVLRGTLDVVLEQSFVDQTNEWGLQLWEAEAGVAVAPDGVSVTDRRAGVKSRIVIGPRTLADFEAFIRAYFDGVDGVLVENYSLYSLSITVYAYKTAAEQAAFEEAFEAALPAHISVASYTYGGFVPGFSTAGDTL